MKKVSHTLTSSVVDSAIPTGMMKPFPHNNFFLMVMSGAKVLMFFVPSFFPYTRCVFQGSTVNFSMITCCLGQMELEVLFLIFRSLDDNNFFCIFSQGSSCCKNSFWSHSSWICPLSDGCGCRWIHFPAFFDRNQALRVLFSLVRGEKGMRCYLCFIRFQFCLPPI